MLKSSCGMRDDFFQCVRRSAFLHIICNILKCQGRKSIVKRKKKRSKNQNNRKPFKQSQSKLKGKPIIVSVDSANTSLDEATGPVLRTLTNDLLFHVVLQNSDEALKGLVCALLSLKREDVNEISIRNPVRYGQYINDKKIVLDSKILLNNNTEINIEIQNHDAGNWNDRALYYTCRNFASIKTGEDYEDVKPFYQIGIIDFNLPDKKPEFYAQYELCNVNNSSEKFNRKLKIFVLSLRQMERATKQDLSAGLLYWAKLFKATTWDEIKSLSNQYPELKEAAKTMYTATAEEQIRYELEMREKAERDHRWMMNGARREGFAKGKAEERQISKRLSDMYYKDHKTPEEIAQDLGIPVEEVVDFVS